jgi:hypothetical protein
VCFTEGDYLTSELETIIKYVEIVFILLENRVGLRIVSGERSSV